MAQRKGLLNILKTKLSLVTAQQDELHGVLDDFVDKVTVQADTAIKSGEQEINKFREMNSVLEAALDFMLRIGEQMSDVTQSSGTTVTASDLQALLSMPSQSASEMTSVTHTQHFESADVSKLYSRMDLLEMAMSTCRNEFSQGVLKHEEKVGELETKFHKLEQKFGKLETETSERENRYASRYTNAEEKIKNLGAVNSQQDDKLQRLEDQLRQMDTMVSDLKQHQESSSVSSMQKEEEKRKQLEKRMSLVEAKSQKDLNHYVKKLKEVESQYKQVCQIVDSRVTPLQRLLRILNDSNEQVEKREQMTTRLDKVTDQVNSISSQILDLKTTKRQKAAVGFMANFDGDDNPFDRKKPILNCFKDVQCNEGNQYSSKTGVFTALQDGLYVTMLTLKQLGTGSLNLHVMQQKIGCVPTLACVAKTSTDQTSYNAVGVLNLRAGDTLFVRLFHIDGMVTLMDFSNFSCFLVG